MKTLDPARDYTLVAVGTLASPGIVAFADDNTLPGTGLAKIRFGNLLADGTPVDALLNFASRATGIAARSVSDYYQVSPATDYTITFTTQGGVNVLASRVRSSRSTGSLSCREPTAKVIIRS